ncbi:MAG: AMP-binding protein [Cyanobacteria bacterium J06638_6]
MTQQMEPRQAEAAGERPASSASLVEILQWRAVHQPQRLAYRFLPDDLGEVTPQGGTSWNYAELHQRAGVIAAQLADFAHQSVILAFPPGLDFVAAFFGCLQAGAIAVPVPLPGRHQGGERWRHIVADARPRAILTTAQQVPEVRSLVESVADSIPHPIACLASPAQGGARLDQSWPQAVVSLDDVALVQYTSGSTSQPRGVMVSHRNLTHNLALIHERFGHSPDSRGVIWLPPHHDMGLIGGILQPLYGGFPVTLMLPASFLRQPVRWLQAIAAFGGTTSGGPNFAYERCLQRITPEQRRGLDLSRWELAFVGAEPVQAKTLSQFADTFADCGFRATAFYPCYGLAEATLFVSGSSMVAPLATCSVDRTALTQGRVVESQTEDALRLVSCGPGTTAQSPLIVDPHARRPCDADQVGEIWLAGPSVAQGYWQQSEATQEVFKAELADGTGSFLRTGDLGFLRRGELFVTGRLKDLILIRGQNHYPQDIEQTVAQSHGAVKAQAGAVFSVEVHGEERLIVVQEVKRTALRNLDTTVVIDAIRAAVSRQHGLQVHGVVLLKPSGLPKTTSGKVQRHACKAGFQANSLETVGAWLMPDLPGNRDAQPFAPTDRLATGNPARTEALVQWLHQYAGDSINSRQMDERRCISPGLVLDFGNQGLLGMQVPTEYAGLGLGHRDMLRVLEQLGAIDPTLALFVGLNNVLGIRPILQSARSGFQADWLPRLATGRELAAFALTEPWAGSNPNAMQSRLAVDVNGGWRLHGEKIWSGSAAWAGVINVFVQHPDASGISGFAVCKGTSGLSQGPEALTMGMRGMVQNTLYLDGVPVSDAQLLGPAGGGMAIAQDAMMYGRLAIAAACIGGMKRCAQLMLRYSSRRMVSTGRLLENPVLLTRLGGLTAQISALSALVNWVAQRLDEGMAVPPAAYTACKILAPEFYWQAADDLVQCLGGRGYIETNLAPQILRDARVLRIFEGPTETLTMHLGAQMLTPRASLKAFLSEDLGAPGIAERLFSTADEILARYQHRHGDAVTSRRWAYGIVGELGAIALLLAIQQQPGADPRALDWTQRYFEQTLAQACIPSAHEAVASSAADTAEWVDSYTDSIGDIEQSLAGEERGLDGLLQRDLERSSVSEIISSNIHRPQRADAVHTDPAAKQAQSPTVKALEHWLVRWLAHHLRLSSSVLDTDKAFADYGVDSVMAVELAQDLEEFLGLNQPLDATLAWNFPTITALAAHLASQSSHVGTQPRKLGEALAEPHDSKSAGHPVSSRQQTLDSLSEAEVADALAAELAALQGRGV